MDSQPPEAHDPVVALATRLRAATAPAAEDVGQLFLACGRIVLDGALFLVLARPGRRLLLRQPSELCTTQGSSSSFTFEPDLTLRVVPRTVSTREGKSRHGI